MRTRVPLASTAVAGIALLAAGGGIALSHGRGVRTEAAVRQYTAPQDGVVVNSGVRGEARTRTRDRRTEVRLKARGLAHHATFGARLHLGRCSDVGPAFKYDPSGPSTRENEVWLDLRTAGSGRASDRIRVAPLPAGRVLSIVIHADANPASGARIACGDLEPD
jgi:hypothetical protein